MSSYSFICPLTMIDLSTIKNNNSKKNVWKNSILYGNVSMSFIKCFGVNTKEEYINLIELNLDNNEKLEEIFNNFRESRTKCMKKLEEIEKQKKLTEFINSIRYVVGNKDNFNLVKYDKKDDKKNEKIAIRLLEELDMDNATRIYTEYKRNAGESVEDIDELVEDYILKHQIYGITNEDILVGCVIIKNKKFKIDEVPDKVNTFYIQEIFISNDVVSRGFGRFLFTYIISRCPNNLKYISFMTKEDNIAMHRIAAMNNFKKQSVSSGDEINPSLFISINENYNPDDDE
jgi:hypothetical protein